MGTLPHHPAVSLGTSGHLVAVGLAGLDHGVSTPAARANAKVATSEIAEMTALWSGSRMSEPPRIKACDVK